MNCADFGTYWNRRLDLRRVGLEALDVEERESASLHAAACASCGRLDLGFLVLERAIATLPPVPAHQPALTASTLGRFEREKLAILRWPIVGHVRREFVRYAAAAIILAASLAYWSMPRDRFDAVSEPPVSLRSVPRSRPLEDVLAEAASATMALARETSAPAARIGRDVIDSASSVSLLDLDPAEPAPTPATVASSSVLERIGQGVRPLREPARNAFGFLIPRVSTERGGAQPTSDLTHDRSKGT